MSKVFICVPYIQYAKKCLLLEASSDVCWHKKSRPASKCHRKGRLIDMEKEAHVLCSLDRVYKAVDSLQTCDAI